MPEFNGIMFYSFVFLAVAGLLVGGYLRKKYLHLWLPHYVLTHFQARLSRFFSLFGRLTSKPAAHEPIDLMVLCTDHFELNGQADRFSAWQRDFPALARRHIDADGCHPKHSFFYALDLLHTDELAWLQQIVVENLGEVELHWHHAFDNADSFSVKLEAGLAQFQAYGHMLPYEKEQKACFAFIHGNWSLANAGGACVCGVDNELQILQAYGCYADFTFPALFNVAQPKWVNQIGYTQTLEQRRGYEQYRAAELGVATSDSEFMLFQGPLLINWSDWRHRWHPTIEDGDINYTGTQGDPKRIQAWVRQGIHVKGRPNWVFVKLFCHGAQDHQSVLGSATDAMFTHLEHHYNDGFRYRLHYVTAREAYNIVKAAEDLKTGNPHQFRDYKIPHPTQRPGFSYPNPASAGSHSA